MKLKQYGTDNKLISVMLVNKEPEALVKLPYVLLKGAAWVELEGDDGKIIWTWRWGSTRGPIDLSDPKLVEVQVRDDQRVMWINVEGVCVARFNRIGRLVISNAKESAP